MANLRRHNQQTVAWFNDLYTRGLLDLEPPYQRRSVWNQAYKDAFIDTILIQYPSPAIFLYQEISPDGRPSCMSLTVSSGLRRYLSSYQGASRLLKQHRLHNFAASILNSCWQTSRRIFGPTNLQ
jgi:hypothetical protein